MNQYLHISNLKISNASSFANSYVQGLPATTGLVLFAHAFERQIARALGMDIECLGICQTIHNFEQNAGLERWTPSHPRNRAGQNSAIAATVDKRKCNLELSLVLCFKNQLLLEEHLPLLKNILFEMKFCGGILERMKSLNLQHDVLKCFPVFDFNAVTLEGLQDDEIQEDFVAYLAALDKSRASQDRSVPYIPIAAGFVSLDTEAQRRENSRSELHCFAEPLVGFAKLSNVVSVKKRLRNSGYPKIFWNAKQEDGVYFVQAQSLENI